MKEKNVTPEVTPTFTSFKGTTTAGLQDCCCVALQISVSIPPPPLDSRSPYSDLQIVNRSSGGSWMPFLAC